MSIYVSIYLYIYIFGMQDVGYQQLIRNSPLATILINKNPLAEKHISAHAHTRHGHETSLSRYPVTKHYFDQQLQNVITVSAIVIFYLSSYWEK